MDKQDQLCGPAHKSIHHVHESQDSTNEEGEKLSFPCLASATEKALVRKIDWRLIPMLFIIYIAAFLDRVNIANALTMGLPRDLDLSGVQPNVALTIFFAPYIVFEIPSNLIMKRVRPHVWLTICILSFGIVTLAQGFVQNYAGILATRFFLGLAEAGIFPGSFYIISMWYKREESQQRFTVYFCSVITASAFGGLLASAIANMDGVGGLASWRWIFILEGLATILVGIAAFFFVCDFPDDAKWLTEEERSFVIARVAGSRKAERITAADVGHFFTDPKNLLGGIMYLTFVMPIYAFAYFTPTILRSYGFSTVQTQLRTVPPMACALAVCLITAYLSDRIRLRTPFIFFGLVLAIIGLAILFSIRDSFSVQYLGICFTAMGNFSSGAILMCWYIMNLRGHTGRSIGSAWMIGFGNAGAIIATFSFLASDAPGYHMGYSLCIGSLCICVGSCAVYAALAWRENIRLKARGVGWDDGTYYSM